MEKVTCKSSNDYRTLSKVTGNKYNYQPYLKVAVLHLTKTCVCM